MQHKLSDRHTRNVNKGIVRYIFVILLLLTINDIASGKDRDRGRDNSYQIKFQIKTIDKILSIRTNAFGQRTGQV